MALLSDLEVIAVAASLTRRGESCFRELICLFKVERCFLELRAPPRKYWSKLDWKLMVEFLLFRMVELFSVVEMPTGVVSLPSV